MVQFSLYNNKVKGQAYSADRNCWVYLLGNKDIKHSDMAAMSPPLCTQEVDRLTALKRWWVTTQSGIVAPSPGNAESSIAMSRNPSSGSGQGGKFRLLGGIEYGDYANVIVKVSCPDLQL